MAMCGCVLCAALHVFLAHIKCTSALYAHALWCGWRADATLHVSYFNCFAGQRLIFGPYFARHIWLDDYVTHSSVHTYICAYRRAAMARQVFYVFHFSTAASTFNIKNDLQTVVEHKNHAKWCILHASFNQYVCEECEIENFRFVWVVFFLDFINETNYCIFIFI